MLSSKYVNEIITITFDFSPHGITPANPTVLVTTDGGSPDLNPMLILSGLPQVSGQTVLQRIVGGIAGAVYELRCTADSTDGGSRYTVIGHLPVEA